MSSKRIAWFDNTKGLLIFLVVFGHLIEIYRHSSQNVAVLWLYNTIYAFHMPLFILISGYFFREGRFKKVVQFTGLYIIWQCIDGLLMPLINTHALPDLGVNSSRLIKLLVPYWTLWYLMGIIIWRMLTPYFIKLKYPIVIAVALAIWASYADLTGWFSLRKVICFYPFFLIGYFLAQRGWLKLLAEKIKENGRWIRAGAAAYIGMFLGFMVYYTHSGFNTDFLFLSRSYKFFSWSLLQGAIYTVLYYGAVTILCFAILTFVPKEKKVPLFHRFGLSSLYIFLLHANIVLYLRTVAPDWVTHHPEVLIPLAFVVALCISVFATRHPVMRVLSRLIEPSFSWLFSSKEKNSPSAYPVNYSAREVSN